MAIFNYRDRDASADVIEAYQLARVSQVNAFGGLSYLVDNPLVAAFGGADYDTNFELPGGWRDLLPGELNVDPALFDSLGVYSSPTSSSAQVKITGRFEGGQLVQIGVSFAGTSDFGDVAAYLDLEDQRILDEFTLLLDKTAAFAEANGLSGADVVVTGYSLGGAVTNALSFRADDVSDGFYADANFFGFASPTVDDNPDRILNLGMENDVVYRSVGDVNESLTGGLFEVLINDDKSFDAGADNIVLFEDVYANPLFPLGPFSLLNITNGWAAHVRGVFETPWETIANSTFYEDIQIGSTVVIAALSPILRAVTWVSDPARITSDHHGEDAYLLGTDNADRLRDGDGSDALDGFAGNDRFELSTGNDRVAGGGGTDRVTLDGSSGNYDAYMLSDGTLYLEDAYFGLKELDGVERIAFTGPIVDQTYAVQSGKLDSRTFFVDDKSYSAKTEGSNGDDVLTGNSVGNVIFGRGGDDVLNGNGGADKLIGGLGDDVLKGGGGSDRLYGGSGNDRLIAGSGNDLLSGDAGADTFDFSTGIRGANRVTDFDGGGWDGDVLLLSRSDFGSAGQALNAMYQSGDDVVLAASGGSIRLQDTDLGDMGFDDILFA